MEHLNLTASLPGIAAVAVFVVAYGVVMAEERLQVRKSVPVLVAALVAWVLVGAAYAANGRADTAAHLAQDTVLEFAELMLVLIPAMTFVNTQDDRGLFDAMRGWLIQRRLSLRAIVPVPTGVGAACVATLAAVG